MMNETQSITETKTPTQTQASFSLSAAWDQKIGKLHELFAHVAKFVDIGTLSITPKVIQLKAMDASHVGMIDILLHWHDFKTYDYETSDEIPNPRGFEVRINFKDFVKLLKNFNKPTDRVELEIASFGSIPKKGITVKCNGTELSLATLEIDPEELPIPKITFNCCMELSTKELRETINIPYNLKADYVEFSDGPVKSFRISASSSDGIEFNRTLDNAVYTSTPPKQIKSIYPLEYLNDIIPKTPYLVKLLDKCELQFMGEMPAQFTFPITDDSRLLYLLAPRVEEEEKKEDEIKCKDCTFNPLETHHVESDKCVDCKNWLLMKEQLQIEREVAKEVKEDIVEGKLWCYFCGAPMTEKEIRNRGHHACQQCHDSDQEDACFKEVPKTPAPLSEKAEAEIQAICKLGGEIVKETNYVPPEENQNPEFEEDPEEDDPEEESITAKADQYSEMRHEIKAEVPNDIITITYSPKAADPIPFTSASKAEAKAPKPTYSQFAGKYLAAHPKTPLPEVATLWRAL